MDKTLEQLTMRKVTLRIVPYIILLYIIAYLDRVNLAFASLTMNSDLGLSSTVFGTAAGIFFIGYFFFEVPSNLLMERIGARFLITGLMVFWGLTSILTALVTDETSLYVARFMLGIAEAGFFPGIILYTTYWFPAAYRARVTACFMFGIPLCSILAGPISSLMLEMDSWQGLHGWQWLFILQGIPALFFAIFNLSYLTDTPAEAYWLSENERIWLMRTMREDRIARSQIRLMTFRELLSNRQVLKFSAIYFGLIVGLDSLGMWLPQIIKGFGLGNGEVGLLSALPYLLAAASMIYWGRHSDQTNERAGHLWKPALLCGTALLLSAFMGIPALQMILICGAAIALFGALPIFWALPTAVLGGTAAAGGIALINSIGNLGGFAGPFLVGWLRDYTQDFTLGLVVVSLFIVMSALLVFTMRRRELSL